MKVENGACAVIASSEVLDVAQNIYPRKSIRTTVVPDPDPDRYPNH